MDSERRIAEAKRITDISQTFPDLASTVSTSVPPYIHPPSVHHSPSKTGTPFPFTAHRSFQETPSPAYPTTSFSLPSTPERQENAETMSIEVAKATSKDSKGYAVRLRTWISLTNETCQPVKSPDTSTQKFYSVRIAAFWYVELRACIEIIQSKQEEYAFQLSALSEQSIPNTYQYISNVYCPVLKDLVILGEALIEKSAETTQERQKLLRTIVAGNHCRLRTLHALALRIQPFLPVIGGARTLPWLAGFIG